MRRDLDLVRDILIQVGDADGPVDYEDLGGGRPAELVGFMDIEGTGCVFHAMVPPKKKFKRELGWR